MYDEKSRLAELSLSCFVRQNGGSYRRIREKQLQRAYSVSEITDAAAAAFFEPLGIYGFGSVYRPTECDERIQFVFRKKAVCV